MATGDLYRRCPIDNCHYGTISEWEQGPNATHTRRCQTCNGIGFVRVDAPTPTDALRAAAQAMSDAYEAHVSAVDRHDKDDEFHAAMAMSGANDALRSALDGVPAPDALTDDLLYAARDVVTNAQVDWSQQTELLIHIDGHRFNALRSAVERITLHREELT